jgi:hypothetical protein
VRSLRITVWLLAVATLVGIGIVGAIAYFMVRDHFVD